MSKGALKVSLMAFSSCSVTPQRALISSATSMAERSDTAVLHTKLLAAPCDLPQSNVRLNTNKQNL